MYVRLAFAVAAHLEPEILIVDEVLAVGDAEFQKKCLGKMGEVLRQGAPSCSSATIWMRFADFAAPASTSHQVGFLLNAHIDPCIDSYLTSNSAGSTSHATLLRRHSSPRPQLTRIEVLDRNGDPNPRPETWGYVKFLIHFHSPTYLRAASVVLYISTMNGTLLTLCSTSPDSAQPISFQGGDGFVDCDFPCLALSAGAFIIGAGLAIPNVEWLDNRPHAATLNVESCDVFGSGFAPRASRYPVPMPHVWHRGTPARVQGAPSALQGDAPPWAG